MIVYTCRSVTMNAFAMQLPALAGTAQYFGNRPVADQTALPGAWDFSFKFTPKIPAGIPVAGDNIPLFESLEKLGLKLEPSTVPLPVLVVESVNQKPTPNSPEAMKAFPPLPTEFEVADLKPSAPTAGRGDGAAPGYQKRPRLSSWNDAQEHDPDCLGPERRRDARECAEMARR